MDNFRCIAVHLCSDDSIEVDGVMFDAPQTHRVDLFDNHDSDDEKQSSIRKLSVPVIEQANSADGDGDSTIEMTLDDSTGAVLLTKQELERHLSNTQETSSRRPDPPGSVASTWSRMKLGRKTKGDRRWLFQSHDTTGRSPMSQEEKKSSKQRGWKIMVRRNVKENRKQREGGGGGENKQTTAAVMQLGRFLGTSSENDGSEYSPSALNGTREDDCEELSMIPRPPTDAPDSTTEVGNRESMRHQKVFETNYEKKRIARLKEKELQRQRQLQAQAQALSKRKKEPRREMGDEEEEAEEGDDEQQYRRQQELLVQPFSSDLLAVPSCTEELGQRVQGWIWCSTEDGDSDEEFDGGEDGESKQDATVVVSNKQQEQSLELTAPPTTPVVTLLDPCVECGKEERTHIAMPCMHFSFCEKCVTRLHEQYQDTPIYCPVCQTRDVAFTRVNTGKEQAPQDGKTEMIWL